MAANVHNQIDEALKLAGLLAITLLVAFKPLVQGLDQVDPTASICKAVSQIGRDLGMSVLAEGVETQAEGQAAQALGCELAQGCLYGRPVLVEEFEKTWMTLT
jgi:EAL domain-containing protein (putative c-di-GMP-specific phosphodiesterase class I)